MWSAKTEKLASGRMQRVVVAFDRQPVAYREILLRWQNDETFRSWFIKLLADAPFTAFRWETPPITASTQDQAFEFVLLDSPSLARMPEVDAFAEHFRSAGDAEAIAFANLGRDAVMIVPTPRGRATAYDHLAAFVRHAPDSQRHALWSLVGDAMQRRLDARPVWLSTAGAGVSWLHVRLDDRPKYYGYDKYREMR